MTSEPGHDPNTWERDPRRAAQSTPGTTSVASPIHANSVHYNSVRHGNHVEESPELLRWRADLLMDEMMMGGVDMSAADGNRTFSGVDAPVVPRIQPPKQTPPHDADHGISHNSADGLAQNYVPPRNAPQGYMPQGDASLHAARDAYDASLAPGYEPRYANGQHDSSRHEPDAFANKDAENRGYEDGSFNPAPVNPAPVNPAPIEPRYTSTHRAADVTDPAASYPPRNPLEDSGYPSPSASSRVNAEPSRAAAPQPFEPRAFDNRVDTNLDSLAGAPFVPDDPRTLGQRGTDQRGIAAPRRYPDAQPDAYREPDRREPDRREPQPVPPSTSPSVYPPLRSAMEGGAATGSDEQPPRSDRLYDLEQQYEQFRREQSSNVPPVPPVEAARPAERPPLPPIEPRPSSPPRVNPRPQPVDEHTQWATGPDKWEYQDFSADPNAPEEEPLFTGPSHSVPERKYAQDSAVRHDPAQFVSAMSVMGNGKKRSTLLPRSTELDIDTLHREISDLHGQIAALLPVGNETSERARHLLDKAYSILQSDPSRSAEVEYYMQQVRTIVQRLHQARQWSDLYRQRLHVYLLGWLGLSGMVLVVRFFFQIDLEDALMWLFGLTLDSWVVAHWATFVGTAAAGAFGGALGALYTMRNHARGEYSFFDRKYGLRGLILPFMGLIVSAVGYVIFGLIFALLGINPSQYLTVAIVPTMAAFAFGFSQESIYGTRG